MCLNLIIYLGAFFTVLVCTLSGSTIAAELGLNATDSIISYAIGTLTGVIASAIIFGIPILLLNINANLTKAVELLRTMQHPPDLLTSVAPVLVDHALDSMHDV